jgi:DtxR family Mn-dependent transcriptional regulator
MDASETFEMYLKTILELENGDDPVAISRIAERWGVTPVAATEMVKRLVERDMVVHTPYKGVTLTDRGRRRAVRVLRRHRLWERFLADHLGLAWEHTHDPACRLEHVTSDEVTEALAAFLEHPPTCPHGNAIPAAGSPLEEPPATPLGDLAVGQGGRVARVFPEETALLEYLAERGIYPGLCVRVEGIAPYDGPFEVLVDGQPVTLGREIAARILVAVDEKESAG